MTICPIPRLPPGPERNRAILEAAERYAVGPLERVGRVLVPHDYFAVDGVRIPVDAPTAIAILDRLGARHPSPAEVDAIWSAAAVRFAPQPMTPEQGYPRDSSMLSVERFVEHNLWIERQRAYLEGQGRQTHGVLTAGQKKDIVASPKPQKVAIYGWHEKNGKPIQPFSTLHEASYADYSHGLRPVWDVDEAGDAPEPLFIASRHFTRVPADEARMVDLVVLHTMESAEAPGTARGVANWFAGIRGTAPKASAHYCVDEVEIVGCVREADIAWAAPGANHNGIQIEMAGRAGQTPAQWADASSRAMLALVAPLVAQICRRWGIPVELVDEAALRAGGARGITTHAAVSKAFKKSSHWDPGPSFPMAAFLEAVRAA